MVRRHTGHYDAEIRGRESIMSIQPTPPLMTAEEFCARFGQRRAELVKGIVKECPVPFQHHGYLCMQIGTLISIHARTNDLGRVTSNDSWIRTGTNPDTIRGADVCFFTYERLPRGPMPHGLLDVVPDLVVEVRSPSDLWTDIFSKVVEYLHSGVQVVVVIDPNSVTASVYRSDVVQVTHQRDDTLTIPDLLPGFAVVVGRLFE